MYRSKEFREFRAGGRQGRVRGVGGGVGEISTDSNEEKDDLLRDNGPKKVRCQHPAVRFSEYKLMCVFSVHDLHFADAVIAPKL